jgi:MtN3 and saliva related transmembrane protein
MDPLTLLGFTAGAIVSTSFFPQVLKVHKSKQARDISLLTFSMIVIASVLWTIYGAILGDMPIIATNVIIFFMAASVVVMKLKYK